MSNDISKLLEDISIRHACKNIGAYITELEIFLDIKLKPGSQQYEYYYTAKFDWLSDAIDKKHFILTNSKYLKMFSIEDANIDCNHVLTVRFKFNL